MSIALPGTHPMRGVRAGLPRRELLLAAVTCAAALAALLVWGAMALVRLRQGEEAAYVLDDAGTMLVAVTLATAGLLIIAHRSSHVAGWLLLSAALGLIVSRAAVWAITAYPGDRTAVAAGLVAWIAGQTMQTVMFGTLPLLFPTGRLPDRRLRWYVGAVAVWGVLQAYLPVAKEPELFGVGYPITPGGLRDPVQSLDRLLKIPVGLSAVLLVSAGIAVMVPRWRRAEGPRRRLTIAVVAPSLLWAVCIESAYWLELMGWPRLVLLVGSALLWAASVGYAFTRDRIWAIDRQTRHLLTAFVLITGLLAGYGAAIAAVSAIIPDARGPGAIMLACLTFAVGVLVRPTARWCARLVDRLYYGERTRPYKLVRDLAERLSRTVRPQDAPMLLCSTVVDSLRLPAARLVVPARGGPRELAAVGRATGREEVFDLTYHGSAIGHLYVRPRDGTSALDGQDHEVLRFLADQAAPAVASLGLYEDLRASREQIVTAREEERRRLRRDIHDGLGPALSALRLRIDTARAAVPDSAPVAPSLEVISSGVAELIEDVRRVADGLVPGALAEVGLGPAVRGLAARVCGQQPQVRVRFAPDPLPELPAAVEAAIYQITAEAITNVVRHAKARRVWVTLAADARFLRIEVRDDGVGMPPQRDRLGVGLQSMAERAGELGGKFAITSGVRGTQVRATLPREISS